MTQIIKYTLEDAKLDLYGVQLIENDVKDSDRAREEIEFIFAKLSGDAELFECPVCGGSGHRDVWAIAACHTCKGIGKVYAQEWRSNELP